MIIKTKKSQEFSPLFLLVVFLICSITIVLFYGKYKNYNEVVGENAFKIMQIYEKSEKFHFFLTDLIKKSFNEKFNNELDNSFSNCIDNYYGYPILNSKNCQVSLNNLRKLDKEIIKNKFDELNIIYPDFSFYLIENSNKDSNLKFSLITKQKYNMVAEIDFENNNNKKCCAFYDGYSTNYFLTENQCSQLNSIIILDNINTISSYEVDMDYCSRDSELSIKLENTIFNIPIDYTIDSELSNIEYKDENSLFKNEGINNDLCSYCKDNIKLFDAYQYPSCKTNTCCNAPCPPNTKKLNFPYYAQCSFGPVACSAACGPTSLKMVLDEYLNSNFNLFNIWNGVGKVGSYTYTTNIPRYANTYNNINAYCISDISYDNIKTYIDQGSPVILLVHMPDYNYETPRENSQAWHFILVVGYSNNALIIHDPYPSWDSSLFKYGKYLVISKDTYENKIYPSSSSYGKSCAGSVIKYVK